jgi:glutamate-1-semialdehyde 2,1-aminomutase
MEKIKSWEIITNKGNYIRKNWQNLANRNNLRIQIAGLPALSSFSILSDDWLKYKTFITQEMLKKGVLATNVIYVCTEHTKFIVDDYFQALEPIFKIIADCESGLSIDSLLEGPVCHSGFSRLN